MFSAQTARNQQMTGHAEETIRYLELLVVREDGPRELGEHVAGAGARRRRSATDGVRTMTSSYLSVLTRTPFLAHSTARLAAMCLTAAESASSQPRPATPRGVRRHVPAFAALYGVCGCGMFTIWVGHHRQHRTPHDTSRPIAHVCGHAANEHDAASALRDHVARRLARSEERAVHVDIIETLYPVEWVAGKSVEASAPVTLRDGPACHSLKRRVVLDDTCG